MTEYGERGSEAIERVPPAATEGGALRVDEQLAALARRCDQIVPEADLRAKLERSARTGKPLRIKLGMDPTAPDVTLGHAVPLQRGPPVPGLGPQGGADHRRLHGPGRRPLRPQRDTARPVRRGDRRQRRRPTSPRSARSC